MENFKRIFQNEIDSIKKHDLFKKERIIKTPQGVELGTKNQKIVFNLCSNNYLGLANDPRLIDAAKSA